MSSFHLRELKTIRQILVVQYLTLLSLVGFGLYFLLS